MCSNFVLQHHISSEFPKIYKAVFSFVPVYSKQKTLFFLFHKDPFRSVSQVVYLSEKTSFPQTRVLRKEDRINRIQGIQECGWGRTTSGFLLPFHSSMAFPSVMRQMTVIVAVFITLSPVEITTIFCHVIVIVDILKYCLHSSFLQK